MTIRRRLFNLTAFASLILCATSITLWVRMYPYASHGLNWMWKSPDQLQSGIYSVSVFAGVLNLWWLDRQYVDRAGFDQEARPPWQGEGWNFDFHHFSFTRADPLPFWERFNFSFHRQSNDFLYFQQRAAGFTVPMWFVVLLTAILPALAVTLELRTRRRERWLARGLCPDCGYDLRATPERCPECGRTPASAATT